jgi:hypothetical protein
VSIAISLGTNGKHTSAYAELRAHLRGVVAENGQLVAGVEDRERELHAALLRGCQDAMLIAQLRAENTAVKAANEEWRRTTIRAKAEQERLRRAVINARPRIGVAYQQLDRAYVSHVQIPYPVPVGKSTANDETQQLPIVELPEPWPAYRMRSA